MKSDSKNINVSMEMDGDCGVVNPALKLGESECSLNGDVELSDNNNAVVLKSVSRLPDGGERDTDKVVSEADAAQETGELQ